MKTYIDLVAAAKPHVQAVPLEHVDRAIADADVLVDVREESEFAAGHLPGAVHMSRGVVEARLSMDPRYQQAALRVLLYCRTDSRATLVATSLQGMGYNQVKVIQGGFDSWVAAGKPVHQ